MYSLAIIKRSNIRRLEFDQSPHVSVPKFNHQPDSTSFIVLVYPQPRTIIEPELFVGISVLTFTKKELVENILKGKRLSYPPT